VDTNDYNNGLPKGVAVICHENFQAYAGSFAHRGLYLPIKRKLDESTTNQKESAKKQKTKGKMKGEDKKELKKDEMED